MLSRLRTALAISLIALSSAASAGGWGPQTTITNYFIWVHGGAYISTANNANPDSCATSQMLYVDSSQPFFKEIWAMVMTAYTSGATVSLQYDGCVNGRPRVTAVAVPNIWTG